MSDLEKDFDEVYTQINSKIAEAAKLLAEANKIAGDAGIKYLGTGYYSMEYLNKEEMKHLEKIEFKPLLDQMEDSGWRVSGLECS